MQIILEVLGTVQIIGGILVAGSTLISGESWLSALMILVFCLVMGSLLICFARIVDLLEKQTKYLYNIQKILKYQSSHLLTDDNSADSSL